MCSVAIRLILKPRAEEYSIRNSRKGLWEAIKEPAVQMMELKEMVLEERKQRPEAQAVLVVRAEGCLPATPCSA